MLAFAAHSNGRLPDLSTLSGEQLQALLQAAAQQIQQQEQDVAALNDNAEQGVEEAATAPTTATPLAEEEGTDAGDDAGQAPPEETIAETVFAVPESLPAPTTLEELVLRFPGSDGSAKQAAAIAKVELADGRIDAGKISYTNSDDSEQVTFEIKDMITLWKSEATGVSALRQPVIEVLKSFWSRRV